ncbi:hypothetical protein [Hoeflea prorocentri]|uniref:Uncharacterized protein n=1 Tax=Hoeflea prorocentri TaxID=1922333 RepID=A0A9X3UNN6_9HYPH|nr:hypothetical protein [Hoeflea prorocentri]MCY6382386.1 hypothetical protein [Hoeflea prorocentri]MDA5400186.1 hypothetical protein [Hoeflea prorocentri]
MAVAIERYLKDFGKPEPYVLADEPDIFPARPEPVSSVVETVPQPVHTAAAIDIEGERAAAFEQGKREATQALLATHEQELEGERGRHRDEVNELRTRYEQDFSTALATRYDTLCNDLVETIGAQVTRVLAPVFEQALTTQMVESLAETIRQCLKDKSATTKTVSGPASVFEALRERLGDDAALMEFVESEEFDLTIHIDDAVLCTRLSKWADRLREVLP